MARFFLNSNLSKQPQFLLERKADFLERLSVLLKEGYTFHDAIMILLPHHVKDYKIAQDIVSNTLRNGKGATDVLENLGFDNYRLLPIEIAEVHGELSTAIQMAAITLRKVEGVKRRLKKVLMYPTVLFIFVAVLFVLFRTIFLPNMEQLLLQSTNSQTTNIDLANTLLRIPDFIVLAILTFVFFIFSFRVWLGKQKVQKKLAVLLSIPYLSKWYRAAITATFSREAGNMLLSGMSLQETLDVFIYIGRHDVLKELSIRVKEKVIEGDSFSEATKKTNAFTKEFTAFINHGEYNGHLGKELMIYSEFLNEQIEKAIERSFTIMQPILFSAIAICILSAYLSLMLPMYSLMTTL